MKQHQEQDRSIAQEQADQVRRTTGATLAARALEEVLPALGKGYGPNEHRKAAAKMSENMDTPGFTFTVDRYEPDDAGVGHRLIVNSNATAHNVGEAASLLEAAPDLFAACAEVVRHYEEMSGNPNFPIPDKHWIKGALMARAALSRAKGGV